MGAVTGFVRYPSDLPAGHRVVSLHSCGFCGKWMISDPEVGCCRACKHSLLKPITDPIDLMIAKMLAEQEGLLQRKYLRQSLSERPAI